MALPLPKVVADVGPGGPLVTSMRGMNALTASNLENQINTAKAEYAPYTERANALSKTAYSRYLPYQIQAQIMSNPALLYMLKDNPEAIKAIFSSFSKSIPNISNLENEIPQPGQINRGGGGGLMNFVSNSFGRGNQQMPMGMPQNAMQQSPMATTGGGNPMAINQSQSNGNPNPLVPAANGDPIQTMINKATAGYNAEPQKPGTTFASGNDVISSPTEATRTAAQSAIGAAERVLPQLKALSTAAAPFLDLTGMINTGMQSVGNFVNPNFKFNLPTQYAHYKSLIKSAPESLVKAYGLNPTNETIDRMEKVIEPHFGETAQQYEGRLLSTLEAIKNEQISVAQKNISRGFKVEEGKQNKTAKEAIKSEGEKFKNQIIQMRGPDPKDNNKIKTWNVPQGQVQLYLDNGFKRI